MVLIVEDEAISRRALLQLLRLSGYEAEAVGSAEEALCYLAEGHDPGVALLDVDLPGMSGLDLALLLEKSNPSLVPVFITASDEDRMRELMLTNDGYYFRKPVDVNVLLRMIARLPAA